MIKPTIGRVIWIWRNGKSAPNVQPEPGLICFVHDDYTINVAGFSRDGVPFTHNSLPLDQNDPAHPLPPGISAWAEWMPFQVGQAAAQAAATPAAVMTSEQVSAAAATAAKPHEGGTRTVK
jgi:hypothetical protein